MEDCSLEAKIEGILFAMGEAVPIDRLCEALGEPKDVLEAAIGTLMGAYEKNPARGIELIRLEDSYQLRTKPALYEYIRVLSEKRSRNALSNAALEVLSIVAYHQPVTRSSIEFIRGVNSDGSLARLVEMGLVDEVGRLDAPGRPVLFGTTEEFLRCFGLSSVSELPELPQKESAQEQLNTADQ